MSDSRASTGLDRLQPGDSVAVALSGGIDSAVAAQVLLERGLPVLAFHLVLTPDLSALSAAQAVAEILGLKLEIVNLEAKFEQLIIEPFIRAYAKGLTPNPCVACNAAVKFGLLWERVRAEGADYLATGHYTALGRPAGGSGRVLVRTGDPQKDQTYFLCRLDPETPARTVFPLAGLTKEQVRKKAAALNIAQRAESQEICFLAGRDYRDFVRARLGPQAASPGDFVDTRGRVLGRHRGLLDYTVGQRRGLGLPGPEPYYVLALDPENNRIVLGTKAQTLSRAFTARDIVWSAQPPGQVFDALVQIRSRHNPAPAKVRLVPNAGAEVVFEKPQSSITAGQAAAFYKGRVMLGGGWIERAATSDIQPPGHDGKGV